MKKVLLVMGTRPEIIKLAPVVKVLGRYKDLESIVLSTGQHREMSEQFFTEFAIAADIHLGIMRPNQSLSYIVSQMAEKLEPVLARIQPDVVLVQGDTTTAAMGGLISYYHRIAVGHVEAGLRTYNIYFPHPEEINRQVISRLATFNFVPTLRARDNLLRETIDGKTIHYVGNTVVDALNDLIKSNAILQQKEDAVSGSDTRTILVTAHRRENFGSPMANICAAIRELAERFKDLKFIFPVHPNPNVRTTVFGMLDNNTQVELCEPLNYLELVRIMLSATIILTDSGGIQEEAPTLRIPVLVLRNETERPEGIDCGIARLVGTDKALIINAVTQLLTDSEAYNRMALVKNPYGDGKAAQRIGNVLRSYLGLRVAEQVEPLECFYSDQKKELE